MTTSVKVTALTNIGLDISYTTLVPVVSMANVSAPLSQKANLQIVGNLILNGATGVNFPAAAKAIVSQTVSSSAQPNVTSLGTLVSVSVTGNVNAGNVNANITATNVNVNNINADDINASNANVASKVFSVNDFEMYSAKKITIYSGTPATIGNNGYLLDIGAGDANYDISHAGIGGNLALSGGNGSIGGTVFISSGTGNVIGNDGNVYIQARGNTWAFLNDGTLSIPGNTTVTGTVSATWMRSTNAVKLGVYADDTARDAAIPSPEEGMMVFNQTGAKFQGYNGSTWSDLN